MIIHFDDREYSEHECDKCGHFNCDFGVQAFIGTHGLRDGVELWARCHHCAMVESVAIMETS